MEKSLSLLLTLLYISFTLGTASYNVIDFGAVPDGRTDNKIPFLNAWYQVCGNAKPSLLYVPPGRFLVSQATFNGPCMNNYTRVFIDGTIVAPSGFTEELAWISFKYVNGLSIFGGKLDGQGKAMWDCKTYGSSCPQASTSLTISESRNVLIRGLTSLNSEGFHLVIFASRHVRVHHARIIASGTSPNTDGIHIQMSDHVSIMKSNIRTGDDCVSMGAGTSNVLIENMNCGPGHGISIGSLGGTDNEPGVLNVTVKSVTFYGTQNGLRIKTWGKPYEGFVSGVGFENITMDDVKNPIIIDQNYCPKKVSCPGQSSGIKISDVWYKNIRGSSATEVAVKFDCSPQYPCKGIDLHDVILTYGKRHAKSFCKNVKGSKSGIVDPPSCL
ncbi:hypothetical protein LUZ60_007622 [Juncus effusus]|nr:hypothetical protein LUZ60_007622 [Juncus effusus]